MHMSIRPVDRRSKGKEWARLHPGSCHFVGPVSVDDVVCERVGLAQLFVSVAKRSFDKRSRLVPDHSEMTLKQSVTVGLPGPLHTCLTPLSPRPLICPSQVGCLSSVWNLALYSSGCSTVYLLRDRT